MEKLSIREASERFGLSRARLYQLLDKGVVAGYRSNKKGRNADSWVHLGSLQEHLHITKCERGRPKVMPDGDYLPVWLAAQKAGYTTRHINKLVKRGSVLAKKAKSGVLVYYPSLLEYTGK